MKKKIKFQGQLKAYIQWPFMLSALLLAMNIWIYIINFKAGMVASVFSVIYLLIAFILYVYNKPVIMSELIDFATQYAQVQKKLLHEFEIPYFLLDETGKIIWANENFKKAIQKEKGYKKAITNFFPELTKDKLPKDTDTVSYSIVYNKSDYRVEIKKITMQDAASNLELKSNMVFNGSLFAAYLFDETRLRYYMRQNEEQKPVVSLIYIDNYEEALESVDEVRRSLLIALIDRKINKYFAGMDSLVKKIEKDKYLLVIKKKWLSTLQNSRFDLMEEVKTVNIGNEIAVTISIGMGVDGNSYTQNYEYARTAIDLALGRGGDQAVIKTPENITYYGGKLKQIEKTTRVKARVKAHALKELVATKDRVIVMGHKISDVDSFGAAIGIYRAVNTLGKKCHIIINDITSSIRPFIEGFLDNPEYEEDLFINNNEAIELTDYNTALVVVDVNKPSFTECEELLRICKTIVVLDHHRQGSEMIDTAVLSYIEPYASSACEMVSEILQYISDDVKIKNEEADCLYAGIMIDTNNFMAKTGVRTFEAAAFLKRNGADIIRVRKLFRNDMTDYKARAEAVRNAEVYKNDFAISVCPADSSGSPTVVGAQAANELLNIIGIKASFVLTEFNNKIYISARSIDEVNVQLIMERLKGGGHLNIAGAQLVDCSIQDAIAILKQTIDKMIEEGAI